MFFQKKKYANLVGVDDLLGEGVEVLFQLPVEEVGEHLQILGKEKVNETLIL